MRIAIDTNILVAATMDGTPEHPAARDFMAGVLAGTGNWCLGWPIVYEFLRVTTHRGIYRQPLTWQTAMGSVDLVLASPNVELLHETARHPSVLGEVMTAAGGASGNFVHDCHIAALMVEHDVKHIVTGDTHFRRFGLFKVWTPRDAMKAR